MDYWEPYKIFATLQYSVSLSAWFEEVSWSLRSILRIWLLRELVRNVEGKTSAFIKEQKVLILEIEHLWNGQFSRKYNSCWSTLFKYIRPRWQANKNFRPGNENKISNVIAKCPRKSKKNTLEFRTGSVLFRQLNFQCPDCIYS